MRQVIDGERLSGHRNGSGHDPVIYVADGIGEGGGSMICAIQSFHWADVIVSGDMTELVFEGKVRLAISSGIVQYCA